MTTTSRGCGAGFDLPKRCLGARASDYFMSSRRTGHGYMSLDDTEAAPQMNEAATLETVSNDPTRKSVRVGSLRLTRKFAQTD